ncbi:amino acid ABC transporter substrate-binding protein [Geminocystis sp. GBBB08]|uniref:amino acid ABC transporter substrate-binding protein n=1 Tax=Geminocystis sp. GBBB08 TaxID=2604140 RepID=UPI0027E25639|nr:amino acid ABC transporter substrate-binding protein [Geminocystis sp. GBBB08]MBL1211291.1 amino acid ABC transporter substrate-binding protein [Geminocystis sp. GBBB08]
MFKKLIPIGLSFSLICGVQIPVFAGEVLNQIKTAGIIRAGYRIDTPPFAFVDNQGKPVGYSLDILELIRTHTQEQLGKPIKLELIKIDTNNRFDKIKNGDIAIECGSTTVTWERDKIVDFSVSYFASGTQMIVKKGSGFANSESLVGAKIGVIPKTTNEKAMKTFAQRANLIPVTSEEEGWQKLQKGEIDGFAGDGILLQALKKQGDKSNSYEIVPEFPYMIESYACTLPENDSQWRDIVNYSIVKFMQGVVTDTPSAIDIYDRWFGETGNTPYPIETMADYFQGIANGYEWILIKEQY